MTKSASWLNAVTEPAAPPATTDAVMTELLDIPNVTPFELEKTSVPLVAVCVPAAAAMPPPAPG